MLLTDRNVALPPQRPQKDVPEWAWGGVGGGGGCTLTKLTFRNEHLKFSFKFPLPRQ